MAYGKKGPHFKNAITYQAAGGAQALKTQGEDASGVIEKFDILIFDIDCTSRPHPISYIISKFIRLYQLRYSSSPSSESLLTYL
jgi:hypothetical protein